MGEFRIGRKFAQHSYPEPRSATTVPFARNSALFIGDPEHPVVVPTDASAVAIPWFFIARVGAAPGSGVDVPITPKTTGRVLLTGTVVVENDDGAATNVTVLLNVGGFDLDEPLFEGTIAASGDGNPSTLIIPLVFAGDPFPLPVGSTTNVEVKVKQAGEDVLHVIAATLSLQEVQAPTG